MSFALVSWVFIGAVVVAGAFGLRRVIGSFRRWPTTEGERRSFFWSRRGGGDM